ncbi:hypothetical protein ACFE04_023108 [Oxalis oulophora]
MREAVRSSVLSTSWRHIWTKSLSNLVLDVDNMLDTNEDDYSYNPGIYNDSAQREILSWKRTYAYFNSVDQLISHLSIEHRIEKLQVYFTFKQNKYSTNYLDSWIVFAISRGVEELNLYLLDLEGDDYAGYIDQIYMFDVQLLGMASSLKCLRLSDCGLGLENLSNFTNINKTLTTLDLCRVDLKSDVHFHDLLSKCCHLEFLSLNECYNLDNLNIKNSLCPRLKYLRVHDCEQVEAIEIHSVRNLESFEYGGDVINFLFVEVPRLKSVFTGFSVHYNSEEGIFWILSKLFNYFPNLETLLLGVHMTRKAGSTRTFPVFHNLKSLILTNAIFYSCGPSWIATIFQECPFMQRLELHEVLITGASGYSREIEFVLYLLNNAKALRKISIDPQGRYYEGDGKWQTMGMNVLCENDVRQTFREHLREKISPSIELCLL